MYFKIANKAQVVQIRLVRNAFNAKGIRTESISFFQFRKNKPHNISSV